MKVLLFDKKFRVLTDVFFEKGSITKKQYASLMIIWFLPALLIMLGYTILLTVLNVYGLIFTIISLGSIAGAIFGTLYNYYVMLKYAQYKESISELIV